MLGDIMPPAPIISAATPPSGDDDVDMGVFNEILDEGEESR